ncbi:hypothetical protein D3C76_1230420 [compost metagenome]
MLEQVGVYAAVRERHIRLHVIAEFAHHHFVAFLFQRGSNGLFDHVAVRARRDAKHDGVRIAVSVGSLQTADQQKRTGSGAKRVT